MRLLLKVTGVGYITPLVFLPKRRPDVRKVTSRMPPGVRTTLRASTPRSLLAPSNASAGETARR